MMKSRAEENAFREKFRPALWRCASAIGGLFGLAAGAEFAMGRRLWGISGEPGLWSGDILSEHNSQYMADPYTFSHITHGVILYGIMAVTARRLPVRIRAILAVALECAWEVVENTDWVIRRYRAETISLHYYGDSVMNSMCDIVAALAGFLIAWLLPPRLAVAFVVILEAFLALWIRDGVFLNLLMLLYPIPAIRAWQSAA
ncbi:MAG TPA: DUF2585 family protein [Candidatus Binataceae bacterium]|nr:DUF2585 family protein [Candidatus Binataceae bacterium]